MDASTIETAIENLRLAGTDTQSIEAKSCAGGLPASIGETVSAFANGNGGILICGISEKDGFVAAKGFDAAKIQDALTTFCLQKMTPPIHPALSIVPFEGSPVLVAEIPELRPKQKPCYITARGCYGGSFVRVGDGDRRISPYEIDRLISEREQPRYDGAVVEEATASDLDHSLVLAFLARERQLHPRLAALDDSAVLRKLHVLKEDAEGTAHPTLAGLLALGSYPQEFFPRLIVSFTCYPGVSKGDALSDGRRFLDSANCTGPIPAMVEEAVAAVTRNMRIGSRIEDLVRRDVPDYPPLALREAIVNAVMHRDYSPDSLGSPVQVNMYADRLEIVNAGGLFGTMTVAALGTDSILQDCRNEYLATILESTPAGTHSTAAGAGYLAENRGTGFLFIQKELERAGKPAAEPRDTLSSFTLVLRREPVSFGDDRSAAAAGRNATSASDRSTGSRDGRAEAHIRSQKEAAQNVEDAVGTEAIEYAIVELAKVREEVTVRELMEALDRSRPTIAKRVADLVRRGILEPLGAKTSPKRRYRVANAEAHHP